MKNSFTIKMSMLTLAAFLLTSTLAVAQPGPRGGGHPGPAPRSGGGGFHGGPSGPRMTPPPSRPHISAPAPKAAPSRPDFRAQAPKPHPGPSARPMPSRAPVPIVRPTANRGPAAPPSVRPAPSRPVAPPSVRPAPSRPIAPPSVRPTPSRPVPPPSVRPTPSRPIPPPSVRPTPSRPIPPPSVRPKPPVPGPSRHVTPGPKPPMPKPGPSHHPMPGPKPGPGYHPGPKPGPGPHHIPSGPRPSWQTRPHDHFDRIYRDVHHAFRGPHVPPPPPAPRPYWNNWGVSVALGWTNFAISTGAFTFGWWDNMYYRAPWWNYYYYRSSYPVYYWWETPSWSRVCRFYPTYGWTNGFYYDYGENVVVGPDSYVYINGQKVTSQYEYAQSAAELATYNMPNQVPVAGNQTNLQWLPLGTFALSMSADNPQTSAKAAIQLAATNDGLISGSFYNRDNNQTFPIQGRVDPQTQRVAFYVIGAENTIFETGMYNLTQQEAPVMVHMNGGRTTKNCLLVRLTPPQQAAANTITPDAYKEDSVALPFVDNNVNNAERVVHSILE